MNLLASIPLPVVYGIVSSLGVVGLIMIFWWVGMQRENARFEAQMKAQAEHKDTVTKILAQNKESLNEILKQNKETVGEILKQYKADVERVTNYYERNVELVQHYEKHADEQANIIHLNTQVMTRLVESINHNQFCPMVRQAGPKRDS